MGYTVINARATDQDLQLTNVPKLASGGKNAVLVEFTFGSLWDDAVRKVATFFRDKETVYPTDLVSDACLAPWEAFVEPGVVYMGVVGEYADGSTRTTEVVALEIVQGAIITEH